MPCIFHDPLGKACIPVDIIFNYATVSYSFINTIRTKIFISDKFIRNLDVKAYLWNIFILPRICRGSWFIEKGRQRIVTGDFRITKNNKFRKLFTESPKTEKTVTFYEKGIKQESWSLNDWLYSHIVQWTYHFINRKYKI